MHALLHIRLFALCVICRSFRLLVSVARATPDPPLSIQPLLLLLEPEEQG